MEYRPDTQQMHTKTMKSLQDCAMMCEQMCTLLLEKADVASRNIQLRLLRDCADICDLCMKYIARHSMYAKSLCHFCSYICEACGNECLKHADHESRMCGQMCLECAKDCRNFAM